MLFFWLSAIEIRRIRDEISQQQQKTLERTCPRLDEKLVPCTRIPDSFKHENYLLYLTIPFDVLGCYNEGLGSHTQVLVKLSFEHHYPYWRRMGYTLQPIKYYFSDIMPHIHTCMGHHVPHIMWGQSPTSLVSCTRDPWPWGHDCWAIEWMMINSLAENFI